jgi:hypothetical protein
MPNIRLLCAVEGDMNQLAPAIVEETIQGRTFWKLRYKVILSFQGTTIQAKLRWKDEVCSFFTQTI